MGSGHDGTRHGVRGRGGPAPAIGSDRRGWQTWGSVVRQAAIDLYRNDGMAWAAALSFYTLLSTFPLLIGAIIVASYLTDPTWVAERIVAGIEEFVPSSQLDVAAIVEGAEAERSRLGLVALGVVLVTGRRVLGTLVAAMNRMSDVGGTGDPIRRRVVVELGLVGGLAGLAALAVASGPALAALERLAGIAEADHRALRAVVLEGAQTTLIFGAFLLTYQALPRGQRAWRAAVVGAGVATVLFLVVRAVFTAVVGWLWASLSTLYGPLATAVFLLTWVYWAAVVVLYGASLASHVKVMLVEGRSRGEAARAHLEQREAPSRSESAPAD